MVINALPVFTIKYGPISVIIAAIGVIMKQSFIKIQRRKILRRKKGISPIRSGHVRRSKYNNTSCYCNLGHKHDSMAEAGYCNHLLLLKKAKEIKDFKTQVSYPLMVNDKRVTVHIVDFEVINKEGKKEVHEYKGFATAVWNLKRKLFEACYPSIPYIVIRC